MTVLQSTDDTTTMQSEGKTWLQTYLGKVVEQIQMMKQHHVPLRHPETHQREPFAACRGKDLPK